MNMTPKQDAEFAQWFNTYYGDPRQSVDRTHSETSSMIKRGLKLLCITADDTNVSHCRNLLQDTKQIQPIVIGRRSARYFRIFHIDA